MSSDTATLLVVEDDVPTRTFLADNLTADGYELVVAQTLREALRALEERSPDLAIVDLGLPDGSGLDLIRRVREADGVSSRLDPRLPLVVLTGRSSEVDRVRGFERGADDFVTKPFSYTELRWRLTALLRRTQDRRGAGCLRVGELALDPVSREVSVAAAGWRSRARSSRCCATWRPSPRASTPKRSCCATCGASAPRERLALHAVQF